MDARRSIVEARRLEALQTYEIMDSPSEESFNRVTRLVRRLLNVPIATIAFIDAHRQWYKANDGLAFAETARQTAICDVVVHEEQPLVVPDLRNDPRFAANPLVTDDPFLRFYAGVPVLTPDRQVIGTLCAMDRVPRNIGPELVESLGDLASIITDELELRRLVSTDSLTGAMSRRAFFEAAERMLALACRHRHDLTCISVDLDHFKSINDTYGHAAGDAVLAATSATISTQLRRSDLIGRLGGEEFAILLPHTSIAQATAVADKLRSALARQLVTSSGIELSVTASLGLAAFGGTISDVNRLLECADQAMYAAKSGGRNRWATWQATGTAQGEERRRVLKAGKIIFNGGRSAIDCTVRSLSSRSAGLGVLSASGIPKRFKLAIEADGFSKACTVSATRANHVEVEFA